MLRDLKGCMLDNKLEIPKGMLSFYRYFFLKQYDS